MLKSDKMMTKPHPIPLNAVVMGVLRHRDFENVTTQRKHMGIKCDNRELVEVFAR